MEFFKLLEKVSDEPVFETSLLLAGDINPAALHLQLSRWEKDGKIIQLRRGLYALAPVYQKKKPHPFLIANRLQPASYISMQSALSHYGLIPEYVMETTSVTTVRPRTWQTPLGVFTYRNIKRSWFHSYQLVEMTNGQNSFIANPEKALLDLIYLEAGGDSLDYLQELRLQNTEILDLEKIDLLTRRSNKPKLIRAYRNLYSILNNEKGMYQTL